MSNSPLLVRVLLGVAALAAVLLAIIYLIPDEPPATDSELAPLTPLPELEAPQEAPPAPPDADQAEPVADDGPLVDEAAAEPPPPAAPPPPVLPPLDQSDAFVREQTKDGGLPLAWTAADNLLRRAAVVIENAARAELPPKRGGLLGPLSAFPVRSEGERLFMDEAGYRRFDPYLDQLEAIDPERLADRIRLFGPLLGQALGELGYADGPEAGITAAIEGVLAVPEPTGAIELTQPKVLFEYADPNLESLGGLQKQVLRMGPENIRRLKAYSERLLPLL